MNVLSMSELPKVLVRKSTDKYSGRCALILGDGSQQSE